jgi:DNA-binding transcriptional LysR family regulator
LFERSLKVADTHHFSHAAHQLNLSPSLVTRYVGDLESHLGVKLLQRSTRKTVLTEVGVRYAQGCRSLLADLSEIESRATQESSRIGGDLNVVVLHSLMSPELAALFAEYQSRHPEVSLHITLTESEVDLLGGGFDCGIVADTMISSLSVVSRAGPCAARRGRIARLPARHDRAAAARRPRRAPIVGVATGAKTCRWVARTAPWTLHVEPRVTVNSALMQRQLALAGGGIALLPEFAVASDLRSGALKRVLADYRTRQRRRRRVARVSRPRVPAGQGARVRRSRRRALQAAVGQHARAVAARPDMTVATAAAA